MPGNVSQKLLFLSVCPVGAQEVHQHAGAPCREHQDAMGTPGRAGSGTCTSFLHEETTAPPALSPPPPPHLFSHFILVLSGGND